VGYRQVYEEVKVLRRMSRHKLQEYFLKKPIPVIIGPDRRAYILDHHHQASSLWVMGFKYGVVEIKEKCLRMSRRAFWIKMRKNKWLHLYDQDGKPLEGHHELPEDIKHLDDNIYQSLAWAARQQGAYAKSTVAVSDFKWPDFFRKHLPNVTEKNFKRLVPEAVTLAHSATARGLPGYIRLKR
jgi:hypothetical protein